MNIFLLNNLRILTISICLVRESYSTEYDDSSSEMSRTSSVAQDCGGFCLMPKTFDFGISCDAISGGFFSKPENPIINNETPMHADLSILSIDSSSSFDQLSSPEQSFEHKSNLNDARDLEQGFLPRTPHEISTQTTDLINAETQLQRTRRSCVESMNRFWGITRSMLGIGECACTVIALYFFYIAPSRTSEQQHTNNKFSGFFVTASFFCAAVKQMPKLFLSLQKKIISCCGSNTTRNSENNDSDPSKSSESS